MKGQGRLIMAMTLGLSYVYQHLQLKVSVVTRRTLTDGAWCQHSPKDTVDGHLIVRLGDQIVNQETNDKYICKRLIGRGTWSRVYSSLWGERR